MIKKTIILSNNYKAIILKKNLKDLMSNLRLYNNKNNLIISTSNIEDETIMYILEEFEKNVENYNLK